MKYVESDKREIKKLYNDISEYAKLKDTYVEYILEDLYNYHLRGY